MQKIITLYILGVLVAYIFTYYYEVLLRGKRYTVVLNPKLLLSGARLYPL